MIQNVSHVVVAQYDIPSPSALKTVDTLCVYAHAAEPAEKGFIQNVDAQLHG